MKLALAGIAALSLVGCATENDGEGGAHMDGLRPAKPSLDDQKPPFATLNEDIANYLINGGLAIDKAGGFKTGMDTNISVDEISVPFPIDGLCQVCEKGVIALVDNRFPDELNIVDKFGKFFCTLWVDESGRIVDDNCR
jgi:hypothetical protein